MQAHTNYVHNKYKNIQYTDWAILSKIGIVILLTIIYFIINMVFMDDNLINILIKYKK